jgi:hypothetical protein
MLEMAANPDYNFEEEETAFRRTFEMLAKTTAENTFRRFDAKRNKFLGSFLITPFEVVAFGLGFNYSQWDDTSLHKIAVKVKELWRNKVIIDNSGTGVGANSRIPKIVPVARKLFMP